jgi:peptide/nickel transport system substrate-binding protein
MHDKPRGLTRRQFLQSTGGLAGALMLAACAPATTPSQTAPAVSSGTSEAAAGTGASGTVTLVPPQSLQTLDPNIGVTEITRMVSGHIYDQIIYLDDDANLQPMLAESWQALDDLTWEFKLRDDVKFHDGTPFNAEVMKFTLERILDEGYNSLQRTYWVPVTEISTPDEFTCVIKTETPMGVMPYVMALTTPVHPDVGMDPTAFPEVPIGTGPFKFVEWQIDDHVVLEANGDYWGGTPEIQQVVFRTIPELSTRMSALEAGEVDIVLEIVPEDVERIESRGNVSVHNVETFRTSWLWMNGSREPFTDVRVRQAIMHAVNMDEIAESIIKGVGIKARAPIAPTVFGFHPNLPPYEYNPDRARELLAEAGYPNGFETTAKGMGERGGYTRFGDVAEVVLAYLAEVGIVAEQIVTDPATANKDLLELNWDLHFAGATAVTGDADNGMTRLYLCEAKRNGWCNEEVDALLLKARESTDQQRIMRRRKSCGAKARRCGRITIWTRWASTIALKASAHARIAC